MIFADALPGFKGLLRAAAWTGNAVCHVSVFVAAFVLRRGFLTANRAGPQSLAVAASFDASPLKST